MWIENFKTWVLGSGFEKEKRGFENPFVSLPFVFQKHELLQGISIQWWSPVAASRQQVALRIEFEL